MPPRRRRKVITTPDVSAGKPLAIFGWCLPHGSHEDCWEESEFNICSCKCHTKKGVK